MVAALETEREGCVQCETSLETGTLFIFKRAQGEGKSTAGYVHLCLMIRTSLRIPATCEWFNLITCCVLQVFSVFCDLDKDNKALRDEIDSVELYSLYNCLVVHSVPETNKYAGEIYTLVSQVTSV